MKLLMFIVVFFGVHMSNARSYYDSMEKLLYNNLMNSEKRFYKYQNLKEKNDTDNVNYTIDNLSKNLLYFSHPTEFNDPFDSKMYVDSRGTEEQWIAFLCDYQGYNRDTAKKEIEGFFKWENGLVSSKEHVYKNTIKVPRVCCFSGKRDSILMWSHYADHHKGICLCFRAAKNFDDYYIPLRIPNSKTPIYDAKAGVFKEVIYDNGLIPQISPFNSQVHINNIISEQLFTKFEGWEYENEYRIIHPEHLKYLESPLESSKTLEYYKECLEGVIFGCRINKDNVLHVYEAVNKSNLSKEGNKIAIKYYKAEESTDKCEIEIKQILDINKFINDRSVYYEK